MNENSNTFLNTFLNALPNLRHVTLANGLNFKVVDIYHEHVKSVVHLKLVRFSKAKHCQVETEIAVTESGSYLPTGEANQLDILNYTVEIGGELHQGKTLAYNNHNQKFEFDLINLKTSKTTKVQTRNGNWYSLISKFINPENGSVALSLNMLGADPRVRNRIYFPNGQNYSENLEHYNKQSFSQHDIVRIEQF